MRAGVPFSSARSLETLARVRMVSWPRVLCLGYLAVFLWLLLTEDPARILPWKSSLKTVGGAAAPVAHLMGFTLLTFLAFVSRWPVRRRTVVLGLLVCASGTELLQRLVPRRTPELGDFVLNVVGIGLGAAIWVAFRHRRRLAPQDAMMPRRAK